MSRLPVVEERVVRLAEESLFVVGEVKAHISKEERLVNYLGALDEADRLELAQAQTDVEGASVRLRAARGRLIEVERRCAQKREIRAQIVSDFHLEMREVNDIARLIAVDATAVGVKHIHSDLLVGCSAAERGTI